MDSNQVKFWAIAAIAIGRISILVSPVSSDLIELLRAAQVPRFVAFPLLAFFIVDIAREESIRGEYTDPTTVNILAVLGYFAIIGIVLNYLNEALSYFGYGIF